MKRKSFKTLQIARMARKVVVSAAPDDEQRSEDLSEMMNSLKPLIKVAKSNSASSYFWEARCGRVSQANASYFGRIPWGCQNSPKKQY